MLRALHDAQHLLDGDGVLRVAHVRGNDSCADNSCRMTSRKASACSA